MPQESNFQFLVFNFFILTSGGPLEGLLAGPGQERHPLLRPLQNPLALPNQGDPALEDLESLVQRHRLGLETPQDLIQPLQIIAKRHRSFPSQPSGPYPYMPSRIPYLRRADTGSNPSTPSSFGFLKSSPRTFFLLKKI